MSNSTCDYMSRKSKKPAHLFVSLLVWNRKAVGHFNNLTNNCAQKGPNSALLPFTSSHKVVEDGKVHCRENIDGHSGPFKEKARHLLHVGFKGLTVGCNLVL